MTRPEGLDQWEEGAMGVLTSLSPALNRPQPTIDATVAAADELSALVSDGQRWSEANPCPADEVGRIFDALLATYATMGTVVAKGYTEGLSGKAIGNTVARQIKGITTKASSQASQLVSAIDRNK